MYKKIELDANDWVFRLLAFIYIEEKIGGKLKDEDKKMLKDIQKSCFDSLKEHYEMMKNDRENFKDNWLFQSFERVMEENSVPKSLRDAKKLLERSGYVVNKKK